MHGQPGSEGGDTSAAATWRKDAINFLAGALAVELACVRRYERHHLAALALASPVIAAEFRNFALEVSGHADRIVRRIEQLGAAPDWTRDPPRRGRVDGARDLHAMIRFNLDAVRVAITSYSGFIARVEGEDPTTLRLLEDIRNDKLGHADALGNWLAA